MHFLHQMLLKWHCVIFLINGAISDFDCIGVLRHMQLVLSEKKTCMFVAYVCKILLKILNIKSKFLMFESVTFRSGHPVLTLISKLHKDS